jgi:hypothetical protein
MLDPRAKPLGLGSVMSVGFESIRAATRPTLQWSWKYALWASMGAMTISVVLYSEVRLLRQAQERAYISTIPWLIIPHVVAGVTAFLSGPLQFSSRLRQRNPAFHRALGRVYVISVMVAAPLAIVLANHRHDPRAIHWVAANVIQA